MTNNIVVQFACSLNSDGSFKEYRVVSGSVFNDEYSETLDSATIVLSQVPKEDRLINIKPYQYVRVYDKSGNTGFDHLYLIDNFDEKENNIKDHIFGYTINLMSETKWLEKIQCPNLVITHDVNNGVINKKTIYEHIKRYMELFVPKIKFTNDDQTWSYEPLIKLELGYHHNETIYSGRIEGQDFVAAGDDSEVTIYLLWDSVCQVSFDSIDSDSVVISNVEAEGNIPFHSVNVSFDAINHRFICNGVVTNMEPDPEWEAEIHFKVNYVDTFIFQRFNVPSADLSFNCPTLRQLLTTLMQQVGCIPTVKNRTLSFLDFQKEATSFGSGVNHDDYTLDNTVNFIRRSLSSDSFVNTLVNISDNVLDSGNEVICETLGFRNRQNVLLKQRENLTLETSLPIYKVNKCILHGPGKLAGYLSSSYGITVSDLGPYVWPSVYYKEITISGGNATIKFFIDRGATIEASVKLETIYFLSRNTTNGSYKIETTRTVEPFVLNGSTTVDDTVLYHGLNSDPGVIDSMLVKSKTLTFSDLPNNVVGCIFSGTYTNTNTNETKDFTIIRFDNSDVNVTYHGPYGGVGAPGWFNDINWDPSNTALNQNALYSAFVARYELSGIVGFQTWDISKLVVENSARQLLDTNFQKMGTEISSVSDATIDKLSKYVYGTVGYSIGSKTISGFSDVYVSGEASALGWIEYNYSYIENIVNVLEKGRSLPKTQVIYDFFDGFGKEDVYKNISSDSFDNSLLPYSLGNLVNYSFSYYNAAKDDFDNSKATFFTGFFVDLYYQPLNSFNLSYVKKDEDIDIPLAQYDGNASGLTDFDRLSINEQEQVDRIGNETLFISQRTLAYNQIRTFENGPLVFRDDVNRNGEISEGESVDYIIFKRSFTINNNCFNISYVGSKDAVLKNYFTSIRTKYRAYQYVDYNASVLRKEKDTFYIRIAKDYYNGDDRVKFSNQNVSTYFMYDLNYYVEMKDLHPVPRNISYELETDDARVSTGLGGYAIETQTIKNSISTIATANSLALIYEYMDNVGAGSYIADITDDQNLGGVPQSWQIWDSGYNDKHEVKYTNYINFYFPTLTATTGVGDDTPEKIVKQQLINIERSPIVDDSYPYDIIFSIVDDNTSNNNKRTFYKDYAERINHTVQFIYYAPDQDVLFGEDFITGTSVIHRFDRPLTTIYGSNNFAINTEYHVVDPNDVVLDDISMYEETNIEDFAQQYVKIIYGDNGIPSLRIYWHNYSVIKLCSLRSDDNEIVDIAVFKRPTDNPTYTDFFFTINDTKTDKVFAESSNGILYLKHKVKTYTDTEEYNIDRDILEEV